MIFRNCVRSEVCDMKYDEHLMSLKMSLQKRCILCEP
jgi:hypothetical protein